MSAAPEAPPAHGMAQAGPGAAGPGVAGDGAFARGLDAAMRRMHEAMGGATPTGDADRDFLRAMIPHHEGAVEMARLLLISGRDALTRRLAEDIIASQQAEIAAMKARLAILEKGGAAPEAYPPLGGTRGP